MRYIVRVAGKVAGCDVSIEHEWYTESSETVVKVAISDAIQAIKELDAESPEPRVEQNQVVCEGGELSASMQQGQWRFRWHVGQWMKWGVPAYDEIFNEAQLDYLRTMGKMDMRGYRCYIDLKPDGSPKRVARFEKVKE